MESLNLMIRLLAIKRFLVDKIVIFLLKLYLFCSVLWDIITRKY